MCCSVSSHLGFYSVVLLLFTMLAFLVVSLIFIGWVDSVSLSVSFTSFYYVSEGGFLILSSWLAQCLDLSFFFTVYVCVSGSFYL